MRTGILAGAAAGAAGTAALNAVTYLDMALRGRASSKTPEQTVEAIEEHLPVSVPGDGETREHRVAGLGSLTGLVTGVGIGTAFGLLRRAGVRPPAPFNALLIGATTMAATDLSMAALDVTDPCTWSAADWLSDVLPHLAFGVVTDAVLRSLDR
ncbi:hypothetical protein KOI35_33435 [Actinoplanes bogorensis]|uniref:DUF1440 domain-containing protein n=1 Tax=Paractinoplanes bogorensis TaxID=1610840 RepID=A0ABS5YYB5_9ACTN|nr:hypothetical protein [Actinoplanes bogorensis]MBU2668427.1 hypothetical protein [Actinoplanes bogorensis]